MKVRVRLFGRFRDLLGGRERVVELEEGATISRLAERLRLESPLFPAEVALVAVNSEYAERDTPLKEGDEVAFLPPLSGGAFVELTSDPLRPDQALDKVRAKDCGAVVLFLGTVREQSEGQEVLYLEYEAYDEMARAKLEQICAEIRERWGLEGVAISHRLGRVEVGEIGLVIAVAAPHRKEAFAAAQYAVDRLKQIAPIWKREVFDEGAPEKGGKGPS